MFGIEKIDILLGITKPPPPPGTMLHPHPYEGRVDIKDIPPYVNLRPPKYKDVPFFIPARKVPSRFDPRLPPGTMLHPHPCEAYEDISDIPLYILAGHRPPKYKNVPCMKILIAPRS